MNHKRTSDKKPAWEELYQTASAQDGYFHLHQAVEAGYYHELLAKYLASGRIQRVYRSVYRIVHFPVSKNEDLTAIWLWSERTAIASHETALSLWELSDVLPAKFHFTFPLAWKKRRVKFPPSVIPFYADIPAEEWSWMGPIPVTTPLRTLLDCKRDDRNPETIEHALRDATRRGYFTRNVFNNALRIPTLIKAYSTPEAFKTALEQRISANARSSGYSINRQRQLLIMDRMLVRIFNLFGKRVILKGGFTLELRLKKARTTKDIDLGLTGSPDELLEQLQQAGQHDLSDYLTYRIEPNRDHPSIQNEGMIYEGFRFNARAFIANRLYGDQFGIDVAFGDPILGAPKIVSSSDFLSFAGIKDSTFTVYPIETQIAEKLHSFTMPKARENSRIKDLPDIALLASIRPLTAESVQSAIRLTFDHRKTHSVPAKIPEPPSSWMITYSNLAEENELPWQTLESVVDAVRRFIDPVLASAAPEYWNNIKWEWQSSKPV